MFERQSHASERERAKYRAAIYTPDECFEYRADMTLDGDCKIEASETAATDELESKLARIARLIARSARKKLADELPPWPHRILRWRGPGRG